MKLYPVMLGGFLGAVVRYVMGEWIHTENGFPLGTLFINLLGCFILTWFLTYSTLKRKIRDEYSLFIGTGFIGSFTTFSTFSVETILLLQNGDIFYGVLYVGTSIFLGLLMAYLGYKCAHRTEIKGETD